MLIIWIDLHELSFISTWSNVIYVIRTLAINKLYENVSGSLLFPSVSHWMKYKKLNVTKTGGMTKFKQFRFFLITFVRDVIINSSDALGYIVQKIKDTKGKKRSSVPVDIGGMI